LTLTARQGGDVLVEVRGDAHSFGQAIQILFVRAGRPLNGVEQITAHAQVREKCGILKHETDVAPCRRQRPATILPDLTPKPQLAGGGRIEPGDGPQQRAFAAAGAAEQGGHAFGRKGEGTAVEQKAPALQAEMAFDHGVAVTAV
jgi:hypothetical protein